MIAAKAFDPVLGVDVHIVQPPGPVPPVPVPHPFVGMLIDPMDFAPIIGSTVSVNGLPRATAGSGGQCIPPHIPIGGVFVKPPANEAEVFMGSSTVLADGDPLSFLGMPALSCSDIGMPPIPRVNKKRKTKSLVLPTSVVLSVPGGAPVLVGGPPTVSMMALGMRAAMAGLGKAFKKLTKTKAFKKVARKFKKAKQKAFKNMKPGFLKCKVLKAEPVDVRTGEVVVDHEDFVLDWPMRLVWSRNYRSHRRRTGVCGHGWETPADARLEVDDTGWIVFHDGTGGNAWFPGLPEEEPVVDLSGACRLARTHDLLTVQQQGGISYQFAQFSEAAREVPLVRLTNLCGHALVFERNSSGLSLIRSSAGPSIAVETLRGRVRSLWLVGGETGRRLLARFEYDTHDNLVIAEDPAGLQYRFRYENHLLVEHTNRGGLTFAYQYDHAGSDARVVRAWGPSGLYDYSFTYDPEERRTCVTDSNQATSQFQMDDSGLPVLEIDAYGRVIRYEYDDRGRTIVVAGPDDVVTAYEYDNHGNLVARVRPDGKTVRFTYNAEGCLLSLTDAAGHAWRQEWDERGLITARITPSGARTAFVWDEDGYLIGWTDPSGAATGVETDALGRIKVAIDPIGRTFRFDHDERGNVIERTESDGSSTRLTYDARGLPVTVQAAPGQRVDLTHDPNGELIRMITSDGRTWQIRRVGLGQVGSLVDPAGRRFHFVYDGEERLSRVVDSNGRQWTFERDLLGRVVGERDFWLQTRTYHYDSRDQIERLQLNSESLAFESDAMGRMRRRILPDGKTEEFSYDANGFLVASRSGAVMVRRTYDVDRRLVREEIGDDWITNYFDKAGRRIARDSSIGHRVDFGYDRAGQLASLRLDGATRLNLVRRTDGQIQSIYVADRLIEEREYDDAGRYVRQIIHGPAGAALEHSYVYNVHGELERISSSTHDREFGYDAAGRRATERLKERGSRSASARRDPLVEEQSERDERGRLTRARTGGRAVDLDWDVLGRLRRSQAEGEPPVTYTYDAQGRRVLKEAATGRVRFGWDGDRLLSEAHSDGHTIEWVHDPYGFEPLCAFDSVLGVLIFHNHPNGMPHAVHDSSGRSVWSADCDGRGNAFVRTGDSIPQPLRLQGQYRDEETGLHYNRNRYYDPVAGKYAGPDPLGLAGGMDPIDYAPNVWTWIDPFGLALLTSGKIYRGASGTPDSLTPRPGRDLGGLSFTMDPSKFSGKVVEVDVADLKGLKADLDNPTTGHVSVFIPDESGLTPDATKMDEWAKTRGTGKVHDSTQELLDVAKKCP